MPSFAVANLVFLCYTCIKEVVAVTALIVGHIPACIAMIAGFVFLVIEMWIPGFGLPGITGIALMVCGIAAAEPTGMQALALVLFWAVLLGIALAVTMRSLAKGRLGRSKLILNDSVNAEQTDVLPVGTKGIARTDLRPSGIAEFAGARVSVVADGEYIPKGTHVTVTRADGNRVEVIRSKEEK